MRFEEHPVPEPMRRHVGAVWSLSSDGQRAPPAAGSVLPDGCVELVVSLADGVRHGAGRQTLGRFVVGSLERPVRMDYAGRVELIAARLRPAAARAVIRSDPTTLVDTVRDLGDLLPALDRRLEEALRAAARTARAALPVFTGVLAGHVAEAPAPDELVDAAAEAFASSDDDARIAAVSTVASRLGVSPRTLERRFRAASGLTPKRFARILRFRRAFERAAESGEDWTAIAAEQGFFDQSHLVREFNALAGAAPGRFEPMRARRNGVSSRTARSTRSAVSRPSNRQRRARP